MRRVGRGAMGDVWRQVRVLVLELGRAQKVGDDPATLTVLYLRAPHNSTSQLLTVTFAYIDLMKRAVKPQLKRPCSLALYHDSYMTTTVQY